MQSELNDLRQGVKKLETELEQYQKVPGPGDNFKAIFEPFLGEAKQDFEDMEKKFKRMEEAYQAALQFFAEDTKLAPEEFFAMMLKFLELFKVFFSFFFFWFFSSLTEKNICITLASAKGQYRSCRTAG